VLSKAEQAVADILVYGVSNKECAERLFVSEKTIKFHVTNIYKQLGVRSRAEFVARYNGLYRGDKLKELDKNRSIEVLPNPQDKRNTGQLQKTQEDKITFIDEKFRVGDTISQLHHMMKEVTKEELSPNTVNAACNCVARLNETINTAIQAARFLNN